MRRSAAAWFADLPRVDRLDQLTRRVLGVAVVALLARVVLLGARVAHYDEGRVGWWALHFLDTGQFEYRYIIHGPLVQHVNRVVFGVAGANDFTLRVFVAVVGAAFPLAALLFRDRLDDDEVLGIAAFLALNPILVYYSRFFRSTLLVAAFSFVAFGLLVRAIDERSVWYGHAAVAFVALAFAAKENAVVYLLCWIGASALLLDHVLFRTDGRAGLDWALDRLPDDERRNEYRDDARRYVGHLVLGLVVFLGISLYFYAPRSPNAPAVGLWEGITNPTQFPAMIDRTITDVVDGMEYWFGGSVEHGDRFDSLLDQYTSFLGDSLETLRDYALPLMTLSVAGFLAERYTRARPRLVVVFAGYWGFVSVVGYPLGTDISAGWIMVNAVVPLTIPAGVGLAMVVRWARDALHGDALRFGIAVFLLFLVVGQVGMALATGVYTNTTSDENPLVQYAQPADDFRPAMAALEGRAAAHEGADVLFVGSSYTHSEPRDDGIEPLCTSISEVLPLQWYVEMYDATGTCAADAEAAASVVESEDPIVIIAPNELQGELAERIEGYEATTAGIRTYGETAVFFVDREGGGTAAATNASAVTNASALTRVSPITIVSSVIGPAAVT